MCVHKHEVLQNTVTTKKQTFQQRRIRAAAMAKCAELLSVALTPHTGASLCSAEPLDPAPCLWLWKAREAG